jgi:hypothetical protein
MNVELNAYILIYIFSVIGLLYAWYCLWKISDIKVKEIKEDEINEEVDEHGNKKKIVSFNSEQLRKLNYTAAKIEEGANVFLLSEYIIMLVFIFIFSIAIVFLGEHKLGYFYTTIAFILGSQTSLLAGYVGMKVATNTNSKTAYKAW